MLKIKNWVMILANDCILILFTFNMALLLFWNCGCTCCVHKTKYSLEIMTVESNC